MSLPFLPQFIPSWLPSSETWRKRSYCGGKRETADHHHGAAQRAGQKMGRRRLWLKIRERNQDLKVALAKAEESDMMKTAFIRTMSHEIRTPLNAVAGFSEVLCSSEFQPSAEEKKDMQKRISSNVSQIVSIVNEVLELSKSESEGQVAETDKSNVACNELARTVLSDFKGKQYTGVEMRFATNVGDEYQLRTNVYRLKSALSHLVDNAIKFTESGHIELRCQSEGGQFQFIVSDTGVGIKEEDRALRLMDSSGKRQGSSLCNHPLHRRKHHRRRSFRQGEFHQERQ